MHKKLALAGKYLVSLLLILIVFLPLLVTIVSSLRAPGTLDAQSPLWLSPSQITFDNYSKVFHERYLVRSIVNTVNITDTDYNFKQISISYKDLSDLGLYNWCETEASNLVGPYDNFIVSITFKDPFGQQVENNSLNFSIDFREKPSSLNSVLLGRDGVYDERGTLDSALSIARQKSGSTIFFPSQKSDNIIIYEYNGIYN